VDAAQQILSAIRRVISEALETYHRPLNWRSFARPSKQSGRVEGKPANGCR